MSSWSDGDSASDAEAAYTGQSLKNLLAVRASATVQHYWLEFRDELQPTWLKEFEEADHNVGEVGWDGFLTALMRSEPESITVKKKAQRPRGGSGNNPFLSDNRTQIEYTVVVKPYEIAKKIMKVREQLAQEWMRDLQLIDQENHELLRHHDDLLVMNADEADRARQLFFYNDPWGTNAKSPLHQQNYRELIELVTKVALRRYETELRMTGQRYHANWLERFLVKVGDNLVGNDLMEAMLEGPMMMINPKVSGSADKPKMINPLQIARGVMKRRVAAAAEFRSMLTSIPDDHAQLMRTFLEQQLGAQADSLVTADHGDFNDDI